MSSETDTSASGTPKGDFLEGQLLIAMPAMSDERFAESVIYLCAHSEDGAMGIILNKPAEHINFSDLIEQLDILEDGDASEIVLTPDIMVQIGGPVETGRGFVLHSTDYYSDNSTLTIDDNISLTATVDILKAIARGTGPENAILALGYAGWSAGQLETELHANGWLNCPATSEIVFGVELDKKYDTALSSIGVSIAHLVSDAGHA